MTSKERLLAVMRGEMPDRVPVSPFIQQEFMSYYLNQTKTHRVTDALTVAKELKFDLMTRHMEHMEAHYMRKSYPNWELDKKEYVEHGIFNRVTTITTPGGVLKRRDVAPYDPTTIDGIHFTTAEYMINEPEDFEIFRKYMPKHDKDDIQFMKDTAAWTTKLVGEDGLCCPWSAGGVYNQVAELRSVEDLMCDPLVEEDFYAEFMQFVTDLICEDMDLLCHTDYEAVGIAGNIANAGMLSYDFFSEFVQPYETKIINVAKSNNVHTVYHNCGIASAFYPAYKEMGMSVFETLSPAPIGDNDFAKAKAFFGDSMTLTGNLDQVRFLKTASVEEVKAMTRSIMEVGKQGGHYIFACSDFLEKGTPIENVKAMIDTANECSAY